MEQEEEGETEMEEEEEEVLISWLGRSHGFRASATEALECIGTVRVQFINRGLVSQ